MGYSKSLNDVDVDLGVESLANFSFTLQPYTIWKRPQIKGHMSRSLGV